MTDDKRLYDRQVLRSAFQSLFWNVVISRKRQAKFTLKALADALGTNKSYVSRCFAAPPNWQIDKLADMADALDVDLVIEARDRKLKGVVYTPSGVRRPDVPSSDDKPKTETVKPKIPPVAPDEQQLVRIQVVGEA
jgi:hypothetical protein